MQKEALLLTLALIVGSIGLLDYAEPFGKNSIKNPLRRCENLFRAWYERATIPYF